MNSLVALDHLSENVWSVASVHFVRWASFFDGVDLGFNFDESFFSDLFADTLVAFVGALGIDVGVDSSSVDSIRHVVYVVVACSVNMRGRVLERT